MAILMVGALLRKIREVGGRTHVTIQVPLSQLKQKSAEAIGPSDLQISGAMTLSDGKPQALPLPSTTIVNRGRAPCQTSYPQRMVIDCGSGKRTYVTNLLQMGIDTASVWSERAGVRVSRSWP